MRTEIPALLTLLVLATGTACSKDATDSATTADTPSSVETVADSGPITDDFPDLVAAVDGVEISKAQLISQAQNAEARMAQMGATPPEPTLEFYRMVLDKMISGELLYGEAREKNMIASEEEVAERMATIRASFPTPEDFEQAMQQQGTTPEEIERSLRQDLAIQKLIETEITPYVSITDDAMQQFYQSNIERMKQPEQVKVSHILIQVEREADEETRQAARTKAAELLTRVRSGEDFVAVARESSEDKTTKSDGGAIPWITRGTTVPPFEEAAFALQVGETSDLVETPFGFHIIRMDDRREEVAIPFMQAKDRIREMLHNQEVQSRINERVESLKAQADTQIFI